MRYRERLQCPAGRAISSTLAGLVCFVLAVAPAAATGTARTQQANGDVRTYSRVHISISNKRMTISTADRTGTLVLEKAACSMIDQLMRCFPYAATLKQKGRGGPIQLASGTLWLNPSSTKQQLPLSSTQLPPRGVLLALKTQHGTYFSLTGTFDELKK